MKHCHKLLLITLLFVFLFQQSFSASPYANQELCKIREPAVDQTATQAALSTSPLSVAQNTCVRRFTIDLSAAAFQNKKYIYIEVEFEPFPAPPPNFSMYFLEGEDYQPIVYINNGLYVDAETDDSDGFRNNKNLHRIVLDAADIQKGGTRYFAVYKLFGTSSDYATYSSSHTVSYTIKAQASTSTTYECINDCSGKGKCSTKLEQCVCDPGSFGSDCSIEAFRLNSGTPRSQPVPAKAAAYYYTPYQTEDDIFTFSFKLDRPGWNVAVQFNKKNDFLVNSNAAFQFRNINPIITLQTSQDFSALQFPALKAFVGGNVLVFVSNPTNTPMYSTVQVDLPAATPKSKLLLTIAIVAGIILFLIIIGAYITAKCRARTARSARNIELEIVQGEPGQRGQRANRANPQQQQQPVFLTKVEIQKYFPLKQFSALKSGFLQSSCSICLDEFIPDSKCHQLYCEHIFHDACIESWLAKQSNCPNCKSEMNKKAIRKFLRERNDPQKPANPKRNKPQSQHLELNINPPENHANEQPEQADRGNLENSVYENSEENPIELQSPIGSPVASPHSSRMLTGDRYGQNL